MSDYFLIIATIVISASASAFATVISKLIAEWLEAKIKLSILKTKEAIAKRIKERNGS